MWDTWCRAQPLTRDGAPCLDIVFARLFSLHPTAVVVTQIRGRVCRRLLLPPPHFGSYRAFFFFFIATGFQVFPLPSTCLELAVRTVLPYAYHSTDWFKFSNGNL